MEKKEFDIAIIGAGPGGYTAAIRAAQLGFSVALIENKFLGGVCLNVGCIPTKALLSSADVLDKIKKANEYGLQVNDISFDLEKIVDRKNKIVENLRRSLNGLLLSNKINIFEGYSSFKDKNTLAIKGKEDLEIIAKKIIIATGSEPANLDILKCDHKFIYNSNSILSLKNLPKTMTIIGGGYIGCEFASFFARLGVKVTILENMPSILSTHSKDVSDLLTKTFKSQNIDIITNAKITGCSNLDNQIQIPLEDTTITSDIALLAVGRTINTKDLNLELANIQTNKNGSIIVNDHMQTSNVDIYAIGDVIDKWMLAHTASHEAMVAVNNINNKSTIMNYSAVPSVIFTKPEIATVGLTLDQAKEKNIEIEIGKFPFLASGKAHSIGEKEGFVQVIIDKKSKVILGASAIGVSSSILISQMALAITNKLTVSAVIDTIHAHPTLPEVWLEACLIAENRPINFPPNMKL